MISQGTKAIYFTADWCGGCRRMRPVINKLIAEGYSIDVIDSERDFVGNYKVVTLPTIIILQGELEKERFIGPVEESVLRAVLIKKPKYEIW
jgi:thioredoxin-like negative regulator of GroEL